MASLYSKGYVPNARSKSCQNSGVNDFDSVQQNDKEPQQGQMSQEEKMFLEKKGNETFHIRFNPDLFASIPMVDEEDEEDVDEVQFYAEREDDNAEENKENSMEGKGIVTVPKLTFEPVSPLSSVQATQNSVFVFPPHGSASPQNQSGFPPHRSENDDVFHSTSESKTPTTADSMFAMISGGAGPGNCRRGSDPIAVLPSYYSLNDPQTCMSLPTDAFRTYLCAEAYKQAEKQQLEDILKQYDYDIKTESETSSKSSLYSEHEFHDVPKGRNKVSPLQYDYMKTESETSSKSSLDSEHDYYDVPKGRNKLSSLRKRMSFSKSKSKPKKKGRSSKKSKRESFGFDDLLCGASLHEGPSDSVPYSQSSGHKDDENRYQLIPDIENIPEEDSKASSTWKKVKTSFQAIRRPKKAHKRSLLLMQAPIKKGRLDYEKDETARKKQYENFCALYPGLVDSSVKRVQKSVNTFQDILDAVKQFFGKDASRSIIAVIIFNGHGSDKGLALSKDDPVPLDTFIKEVTELLEAAREENKLPHIVKIVFAQCYGHLYTEPESRDIQVVSFTNAKKLTTQARIQMNGLTNEVADSCHHQLKQYASRTSLTDETMSQIRGRSPSTTSVTLRSRHPSSTSLAMREIVPLEE